MLTKRMVEDAVAKELENKSFEEVLEVFDLDPVEVFWILFKLGYIDQELMDRVFER